MKDLPQAVAEKSAHILHRNANLMATADFGQKQT
jgi:hypothetical protein